MTKIGNFELGIKPGIVAIIDEMISVQEITALKGKGIDLIELRIDCFDAPLEETVSYVKRYVHRSIFRRLELFVKPILTKIIVWSFSRLLHPL